MESISKEDMNLLLEKGILKTVKGQIIDLVVVSKRKKHDGKTRYVTDPIYEQLQELKGRK